jgi:hypothetical protein
MYANQQEAFAIVAKDVREAAKAFALAHSEKRSSVDRSGPASVAVPGPSRSSNLRVKRKFDAHERDEFIEDSYEYIARYFEGSLEELSKRNPQIKGRFKRLDATSFSASVYEGGARVAQCSVWYGGQTFGSPGIAYSHSVDSGRNSFNESLSVVNDGFTLQLKPLGMQLGATRDGEALSQQGAAEYYWSMLIRPLQE